MSGSKCVPRPSTMIIAGPLRRQGGLVGPGLDQRVVDVHHRHQPAGQRNGRAAQAARIARSVPTLVVRVDDFLGRASTSLSCTPARCSALSRLSWPSVACRFISAYSSSVRWPGLVQHGVGDADLADVVQRRQRGDEIDALGREHPPVGGLAARVVASSRTYSWVRRACRPVSSSRVSVSEVSVWTMSCWACSRRRSRRRPGAVRRRAAAPRHGRAEAQAGQRADRRDHGAGRAEEQARAPNQTAAPGRPPRQRRGGAAPRHAPPRRARRRGQRESTAPAVGAGRWPAPPSSVSATVACSSTPGKRGSSGVATTSRTPSAVAPTKTIRPVNVPGGEPPGEHVGGRQVRVGAAGTAQPQQHLAAARRAPRVRVAEPQPHACRRRRVRGAGPGCGQVHGGQRERGIGPAVERASIGTPAQHAVAVGRGVDGARRLAAARPSAHAADRAGRPRRAPPARSARRAARTGSSGVQHARPLAAHRAAGGSKVRAKPATTGAPAIAAASSSRSVEVGPPPGALAAPSRSGSEKRMSKAMAAAPAS